MRIALRYHLLTLHKNHLTHMHMLECKVTKSKEVGRNER